MENWKEEEVLQKCIYLNFIYCVFTRLIRCDNPGCNGPPQMSMKCCDGVAGLVDAEIDVILPIWRFLKICFESFINF